MNTEWKDDLKEISKCLRECILPRLTQLEVELFYLRKHVWPYVQAMKEVNQLDDIPAKREFMSDLDDDTIRELLTTKAKFSKSGNLLQRELHLVTPKSEREC
jgi:hypothetical protein